MGGPLNSLRQRIRPHLEVQYLAHGPFPSFHVKRCARAHRREQASALPTSLRIIDPAIHPLRVETEWIWNAEDYPFPIFQRQKPFRSVTSVDRHVLAQSECIELIDPGVIAGFGAPRVGEAFELRQRLWIEGPPLGAMLTGCCWSVEGTSALAAIETGEMTARQRHPRHAISIDVETTRREPLD